MSLTCGRKNSSSGGLYGTGVSWAATLSDRSVEEFERFLGDARHDFAARSAGEACFVQHDHLAGLLAAVSRIASSSSGSDRSQVEHLDVDAPSFASSSAASSAV